MGKFNILVHGMLLGILINDSSMLKLYNRISLIDINCFFVNDERILLRSRKVVAPLL